MTLKCLQFILFYIIFQIYMISFCFSSGARGNNRGRVEATPIEGKRKRKRRETWHRVINFCYKLFMQVQMLLGHNVRQKDEIMEKVKHKQK